METKFKPGDIIERKDLDITAIIEEIIPKGTLVKKNWISSGELEKEMHEDCYIVKVLTYKHGSGKVGTYIHLYISDENKFKLISREKQTIVSEQIQEYKNRCEKCNSPIYIGLFTRECINPNCSNH